MGMCSHGNAAAIGCGIPAVIGSYFGQYFKHKHKNNSLNASHSQQQFRDGNSAYIL